jgi:hypothetical protein
MGIDRDGEDGITTPGEFTHHYDHEFTHSLTALQTCRYHRVLAAIWRVVMDHKQSRYFQVSFLIFGILPNRGRITLRC